MRRKGNIKRFDYEFCKAVYEKSYSKELGNLGSMVEGFRIFNQKALEEGDSETIRSEMERQESRLTLIAGKEKGNPRRREAFLTSMFYHEVMRWINFEWIVPSTTEIDLIKVTQEMLKEILVGEKLSTEEYARLIVVGDELVDGYMQSGNKEDYANTIKRMRHQITKDMFYKVGVKEDVFLKLSPSEVHGLVLREEGFKKTARVTLKRKPTEYLKKYHPELYNNHLMFYAEFYTLLMGLTKSDRFIEEVKRIGEEVVKQGKKDIIDVHKGEGRLRIYQAPNSYLVVSGRVILYVEDSNYVFLPIYNESLHDIRADYLTTSVEVFG